MRAGALDTRIEIQRSTTTIDAAGTPTATFVQLARVSAQVVEASTVEYIRNFGASDETVTVFRIRYREGLTNADRVIWNGIVHNIKEIKEIRRRRGLELRTASIGKPA